MNTTNDIVKNALAHTVSNSRIKGGQTVRYHGDVYYVDEVSHDGKEAIITDAYGNTMYEVPTKDFVVLKNALEHANDNGCVSCNYTNYTIGRWIHDTRNGKNYIVRSNGLLLPSGSGCELEEVETKKKIKVDDLTLARYFHFGSMEECKKCGVKSTKNSVARNDISILPEYKNAASKLKAAGIKFQAFGNPSGRGIEFFMVVDGDDEAKKRKAESVIKACGGKMKADWHLYQYGDDAATYIVGDSDWRSTNADSSGQKTVDKYFTMPKKGEKSYLTQKREEMVKKIMKELGCKNSVVANALDYAVATNATITEDDLVEYEGKVYSVEEMSHDKKFATIEDVHGNTVYEIPVSRLKFRKHFKDVYGNSVKHHDYKVGDYVGMLGVFPSADVKMKIIKVNGDKITVDGGQIFDAKELHYWNSCRNAYGNFWDMKAKPIFVTKDDLSKAGCYSIDALLEKFPGGSASSVGGGWALFIDRDAYNSWVKDGKKVPSFKFKDTVFAKNNLVTNSKFKVGDRVKVLNLPRIKGMYGKIKMPAQGSNKWWVDVEGEGTGVIEEKNIELVNAVANAAPMSAHEASVLLSGKRKAVTQYAKVEPNTLYYRALGGIFAVPESETMKAAIAAIGSRVLPYQVGGVVGNAVSCNYEYEAEISRPNGKMKVSCQAGSEYEAKKKFASIYGSLFDKESLTEKNLAPLPRKGQTIYVDGKKCTVCRLDDELVFAIDEDKKTIAFVRSHSKYYLYPNNGSLKYVTVRM